MNQRLPLISALVTTHDRPQLLRRALDSIAVQTWPNFELIVVDDGSEKNVEGIVMSYQKNIPVRFLRNVTPEGACKARNQGIEAAKGEIIAGLDDDDDWSPKRLEKMAEAYTPEVSFVTSDVRMVYQRGQAVWKKPNLVTLQDLFYSNAVGNQGLIKKKFLLEVGGFDESLVAAQDYDLWIRLCERFGPVANVKEPLQTVYMDHDSERISNPRDQLRGYLRFYQKHKSKMNRSQRKYQLYNIRKATGKATGFFEIFKWAPPHRYRKEIIYRLSKTWLAG